MRVIVYYCNDASSCLAIVQAIAVLLLLWRTVHHGVPELRSLRNIHPDFYDILDIGYGWGITSKHIYYFLKSLIDRCRQDVP